MTIARSSPGPSKRGAKRPCTSSARAWGCALARPRCSSASTTPTACLRRPPPPASCGSAPGADALLDDLAPGPDGDALVLWSEPQPSPSGAPDLLDQSIFAARGFDAYPRRTIFGRPEEVAQPGPHRHALGAVGPRGDGAPGVLGGQNGAIEYSIHAAASAP